MENHKTWPCYIGITKNGAGIFLSDKIIERKKYGQFLHTQTFESFEEAVENFTERYGKVIFPQKIRLNKLYVVKEKKIYSVFSTPYMVGMTYSEFYENNLKNILSADEAVSYARHNLEYEIAIQYVRSHFERYYNNPALYINFAIHMHQPIYLYEVKNANKVND